MAVINHPIAISTPLNGDKDLLALESVWRATMVLVRQKHDRN